MKLEGLQKTAQVVGSTITKNSPSILTGLGVAGLFTTAIMGITATPKAIRLIEEEEKRHKAPLTKKEIIATTWKCYAPTAAMGIFTAVCIIGGNSISLRRNAALAGAYTLTEKALKEYQAKVVEKIGESKHREIKDEIIKDKMRKNPVSTSEVIMTGRGEVLCQDALSGRYFKSSMEEIQSTINDLNRQLMNDMFISLNEMYSDLGLDGNKTGDQLGWYIEDGLIEPRFSTQLADDGRPCLVLDFDLPPRYSGNH